MFSIAGVWLGYAIPSSLFSVFTDLVKLPSVLCEASFLGLNLTSIQPRTVVVVPSAGNARLSTLRLRKCKWDNDPSKGSALSPLAVT